MVSSTYILLLDVAFLYDMFLISSTLVHTFELENIIYIILLIKDEVEKAWQTPDGLCRNTCLFDLLIGAW